MLSYQTAIVKKIIDKSNAYTEILVESNKRISHAINYDNLTGLVKIGDKVIINTTANELSLGTGGYDFVISNLERKNQNICDAGHIMKLRYSPMQIKVLSVEEENSPHHALIKEKNSLEGATVIIGTLHSMLAPIVFALSRGNEKKQRVIYIMTDGASLPIMFSKSVRELSKNNLIHGSITAGNAFGGDLEAVNIYSALLAAKWVLKADYIVVCMGPGIVGTGTKWGFTGIEQGQIINAVTSLKGVAIAVPRVSFADPRPRHRGLSHHTITVLKNIALAPAIVPFGLLEKSKMNLIHEQWTNNNITLHKAVTKDTDDELKGLASSGLSIATMNRGLKNERDFFSCCSAAGVLAKQLFNGELYLNNL